MRKERILDAAEEIFAVSGFEGASLRAIVAAADVNLATVYYYFGSKEGLLEAVLKRCFGPMRQEQLDLFRQFEAEANGQPLALENILRAMLAPPLRLAAASSTRNPMVMRLIGRMATDPHPQAQALIRTQHQAVREISLAALRRSLPHLPLPDLEWRVQFVWGALVYLMSNPSKIERQTGGLCNPLETETVLTQMLHCFSAGLNAPAEPPPGPPQVQPHRRKARTTPES